MAKLITNKFPHQFWHSAKRAKQCQSWCDGKVVVILGTNASGKSELAVKIAKKFGGEIISADSRQVYKNLNIGAGKVEGAWKRLKKAFIYKDIPHYCIDFVSPKKIYTAAEYQKCAREAIEEILSRGKIPIICGGTGFYIDAALGNIKIPEIRPDWTLRKKLEKKSSKELFKSLQKINPGRSKNIDPKNKRRLIRAIEIAKYEGSIFIGSRVPEYKVLYLGITHPPEILKKRIEKRLIERLNQGMLEEVQTLHYKKNLSWRRLDELGLEYRCVSYFLRGKIKTEKELIEKLKTAIWRYAKRQLTWFKRNKKIHWIKSEKEAEILIGKFLKT